MKFEDLKELKCGNEIIIQDPLKQEATAYVLMSIIEERPDYYFVSAYGASLMIDKQETIDGFNVDIIDDQHPSWDSELSKKGKAMGEMLDQFKIMDELREAE